LLRHNAVQFGAYLKNFIKLNPRTKFRDPQIFPQL